MVERVTGTRPHTCPWQAFSDPDVGAVLDLYRMATNGMGAHLASVWGMNPPAYLWDGLQHYAHAVAKVQEAHDKAAEERRRKR